MYVCVYVEGAGGGDDTAAVVEFFESYLWRRWEELRFLTFAENEALLGTVVDIAVRNPRCLPDNTVLSR